MERINLVRGKKGKILSLTYDKSATLGLGTDMAVVEPADHATFFRGSNAYGRALIGSVTGDYGAADLGSLTPLGVCKENGCTSGPNGALGGRTNNGIICPMTSATGRVYATLVGGGLFVVDPRTTPMSIVGEYGREVIYGAGCGAVELKGKFFVNSGIVGSAPGATQSVRTFGVVATGA
jgi:hypothetical protein